MLPSPPQLFFFFPILTFIKSQDQNSSLGTFLLIQLDIKVIKNSLSFTNSHTQAHKVNKMNVWQYLCCPDWNYSAQAAPSGKGEGWDPLDGNMKCLNQRKCPLRKVSAFLHPYKKCLKSVTVKLPKITQTYTFSPPLPHKGFVCYFLLLSLLNKWKCRNPFLKPNSAKIVVFFLSTSFQSLSFLFSADKSEIILVF